MGNLVVASTAALPARDNMEVEAAAAEPEMEVDFAADDGDEIISEPTLLDLSLAQLAAANKTEHKAERQQSQLEERRAVKKKKKKKGGDFLGGVQSRKGISKNAENRKSFKTRPGKGKGAGARNSPAGNRKMKKGGRGGKGNAAAPGRKGLAPIKKGFMPKTPIQKRLGMSLDDLSKLSS